MDENFDCTQFLTFNSSLNEEKIDELLSPLKDVGFNIIKGSGIREIKRIYFKKYIEDIYIELGMENFIGELDMWEDINNPSKIVERLIEVISAVAKNTDIRKLKVILASFSEVNKTSDEEISTSPEDIAKGLFTMSKNYYDIWADNLIINIIK